MATCRDLTFSISVPVYEQAEYLGTALQSIRAQSVPFELAVLDASPDDAAEQVIREYAAIVAYHYHRADAGQAAAIQEGWARTRGDVVAWLNADDYYFPDTLARVAAVFRASPEVDVVYGHGVHISAGGVFQMYFPAVDRDIRSINQSCTVCQPACFVRRSAMEHVGGLNQALHYTMDWDLWLRLYRAGCTFRFLDAPLAVVRVHPATKTLSGAAQRYREVRELLRAGGASSLRRLATVMALHHYDLRNRRHGPLAWAAYRILSTAARTRRVATRHARRRINGLECWTNRVEDECVVELPWYEEKPPRHVMIVTDRPTDLSLVCNGQPAMLQYCGAASTTFVGESITGQGYQAALEPRALSVLAFHIAARNGPWRLLSLGAGSEPCPQAAWHRPSDSRSS
jgi:glycosyltransferase involved in cell wall biosynthesis